MTLFFIIAALLVVLCLFWLLAALFKSHADAVDQEAVNITLARERLATLDAALADGSIDQASYAYEREQLDYDLAADLRSAKTGSVANGRGQMAAAMVIAVFVPLAAGALYLQLGNPAAISMMQDADQRSVSGGEGAGTMEQAPALADLLPQLEARLATTPDDVDGWRLLGRSYLSVNEFAKAQDAFARALALDDGDVATLAQLAESIAMIQGGDLAGEPTTILERANRIDPANEHTLWLLSIARQQTGDHEAALSGFDRLSSIAQDNPEALATIEQMRERSVQAMSTVGEGARANNRSSDDAGPDSEGVAETAKLKVSVDIDATVLAAVPPDTAVFIYATAADGPPMPLAVSRRTVKDLPLDLTLDDSMAMIPNMTLSAYPEVTVGARVSVSGNPIAQSGDWFAEQNNVRIDSGKSIRLNIKTQVP
ncbi:MAG: c-type cytochrome biogenesis protein CcmI [Granulosicoccus sp.]|nr:c-type cytochrome biogenesis protein CcmI [Granulosicoccus sp.]